jgi:hypothetical protein
MTIRNQTTVPLTILGQTLEAKKSGEFTEHCFDQIEIKSKFGKCVITSEYGHRHIRNYGKIKAKQEKNSKDPNGLKTIVVLMVQ